ncbi:MAG TPA: hypothetical protein VF221_18910 [Chloroflexota bacterium]
MSTPLAAVPILDPRRPAGPMHRSIVAVDLEGSTTRTNLVKGELRRIMYDLLRRTLEGATITENLLEPLTDRGDGILVLIRPHDQVPKTVLLEHLIPQLTALLVEHNATVTQHALRVRLRAVVHAGEVHSDSRGFYGEAIDVAIRLMDSAAVKKALKLAAGPLVLVVSEEIHSGIVRHGYVDGAYRPLVRVRVGYRQHRGWVHIPDAGEGASTEAVPLPARPVRSPALTIARERVERIVPAIIGTGSR